VIVVPVCLPRWIVDILDDLVSDGVFPSRSEAIRFFILEGLSAFERSRLREFMSKGENPSKRSRRNRPKAYWDDERREWVYDV